MLPAPLAGALLVLSIATGPAIESQGATQMTTKQKNAAMQPLVRSATECIARAVTGDPRFGSNEVPSNIGDLITELIPTCVRPVRAMIDGYDRYFGAGAGEAFFMGPYLDVLPTVVSKWTAGAAQ
jgi:hypothetical protein